MAVTAVVQGIEIKDRKQPPRACAVIRTYNLNELGYIFNVGRFRPPDSNPDEQQEY
jgi:hypothetical protein